MKETIEIKKEDLEKVLMECSSLSNNSFLSDEEKKGVYTVRQIFLNMLERNNLSATFEYDRYYHEIACKIKTTKVPR